MKGEEQKKEKEKLNFRKQKNLRQLDKKTKDWKKTKRKVFQVWKAIKEEKKERKKKELGEENLRLTSKEETDGF